MCPLKNDCPKVKMLRWPTSSLKSHTKFGKDCPYAHHPMELQFPETLSVRLQSNQKIVKAETSANKGKKQDFKWAGTLWECNGHCGHRCNMC